MTTPNTAVDPNMLTLNTASNFQFSAVGIDSLGASQFTLVNLLVDVSGSVSGYEKMLEDCLKAVLRSCKQPSMPTENIMIRVTRFGSTVEEVHGFRCASDIKEAEYTNTLHPSGSTLLCDAVLEALEASMTYARLLDAQDYDSNTVLYVITDGSDNGSTHSAGAIKRAMGLVKQEEILESAAIILIGVGCHNSSSYLTGFQRDADITQFVDMEAEFKKGDPAKLFGRMGGLISKSISSTSQALKQGTSQPIASTLTF